MQKGLKWYFLHHSALQQGGNCTDVKSGHEAVTAYELIHCRLLLHGSSLFHNNTHIVVKRT